MALKFVFWEKLFTARHESRLWRPHLASVFPNLGIACMRTARQRIADDLRGVRLLRNRIAHHEPVFQRPLLKELQTIERLVSMRCLTASNWLARQHSLPHLLQCQPWPD
ncbi:hypothetical protein [Pseudomonas sp. NPDC007930]|uniref:hypothetical protein n=1 Tax=Pseudomonas sp. NPDC007930 TaxID=3364417 RepID=UPI0036E8231B